MVDTAAALAGRHAVVGAIPSGKFPREMAVIPALGTLLVTDYASDQLEALAIGTLP